MILTEAALVRLADVVGARLSVSPEVKPAALRAAAREAEHLAADIYDTPGALVFALARNPSAFRAFAPMIVAAAAVQASVHGMRCTATPREIVDVAAAAGRGDMSWEEVHAFFAKTTLPFAG